MKSYIIFENAVGKEVHSFIDLFSNCYFKQTKVVWTRDHCGYGSKQMTGRRALKTLTLTRNAPRPMTRDREIFVVHLK